MLHLCVLEDVIHNSHKVHDWQQRKLYSGNSIRKGTAGTGECLRPENPPERKLNTLSDRISDILPKKRVLPVLVQLLHDL